MSVEYRVLREQRRTVMVACLKLQRIHPGILRESAVSLMLTPLQHMLLKP